MKVKIWCEVCRGFGKISYSESGTCGLEFCLKDCSNCNGKGYYEKTVQDWYKDIQDFMTAIGQEVNYKPTIPSEKQQLMASKLVREEVVDELLPAMWKNDLVGIADGIVDSIVVILDVAVAYGIDIRPIWDMVHEANMKKVAGPVREDGKRLKPEGWKHPDIGAELERQKNT